MTIFRALGYAVNECIEAARQAFLISKILGFRLSECRYSGIQAFP